jgi:hypothetical protein
MIDDFRSKKSSIINETPFSVVAAGMGDNEPQGASV